MLLAILLVIGLTKAEIEYVTYETEQGDVRGIVRQARSRRQFHAFLGIPYAQPPLETLRWMPPTKAPKWEGTFDASKTANVCAQDKVYHPQDLKGSEDCLYLNVFTGGKSKKKQVLFWIHGGAFIFGGADNFGADYIMEEDVVLVTVQYRLNIFGFLSTEDASAPGNYGLLDQIAALKWVQDNIAAYGGDPDQVTIIGMSAGGASVHYLTLSPMTKSLYKNAISLSGSALCWWANVPNPNQKAVALGERFGCPMTSSVEMVNCLRKVSTEKLHRAHQELFFQWHQNSVEREPMNVFSPRSDPEAGSEAVIPEHPYVAMKKGRINTQPHMFGYADKEGAWRANHLFPDGSEVAENTYQDFIANFSKVAPLSLGLFGNQCKNPELVLKKLEKFYKLDGINAVGTLTDEMVINIIDILSDSMFNYAIDEAAKLRAQHKELHTYYYYFKYPGAHTLTNLAIDESIRRPPLKPLRRATHGTDMLLMFNMFNFDPMPEEDIQVSRKFIKFLIDWARRGEAPDYISDWKPFDLKNPSHLIIDEEFSVQPGLPDQERFAFWKHQLDPVYWSYNAQGHNSQNHEEL